MPCDIFDVDVDETGPSGAVIPGFGKAFSLNLGGDVPVIEGFPENLQDIFDKLTLLLPPGPIQPTLNPNFGKDTFDGVLKLLDSFMPFLMLYKFFMPILNIIVCIIEVLCSLLNPIKMVRALQRLFRNCIPAFLNLFPIFALIIMLISLLLLLLSLIEYIIQQVVDLIELILLNLNALTKAITDGDANSILAVVSKIGSLLCIFQNLFVLLSLFTSIFDVIRDLLRVAISIPPCDNKSNSDDSCCSPDVCPEFVKQDYTRETGSLQYNSLVTVDSGLDLPSFYGSYDIPVRTEGWLIYDIDQTLYQKFTNITNAEDIPDSYGDKPNFFPTDGVYNKESNIKSVPYTVNVKVFYVPSQWGRDGYEGRVVEFKDCVVLAPPTQAFNNADGSVSIISTGVLQIEGGKGYEEDGSILFGYAQDGITQTIYQANLNNFLHFQNRNTVDGTLFSTDGYSFSDIEYTFHPNFEYLVKKQLVTLGCEPSLELDKEVINSAFASGIAILNQDVVNILDNGFPSTSDTIDELNTAIANFRRDMTAEGADAFSKAANASLDKLKTDTKSSLTKLVGVGVSPCDSTIELDSNVQFTTKPIKVSVSLNERNKISIAKGMPLDVGEGIAKKLIGYTTFGNVSKFHYDGSSLFVADLTSDIKGTGLISVAFDGQMLCKNNIPVSLDVDPSIDIQQIPYEFVFSTTGGSIAVSGDGQPRRDESDVSREGQ